MKGDRENTYKTPLVVFLFIILFTSAISLSGCSQNMEGSVHVEAKHDLNRLKETPGISFLGASIIPIQDEDEEFYKAAGWLTNLSILYIANKGESSILYSYNLAFGKANMLYESENPIIAVEISPDKKKILIHSAATNTGILTIIDISGKEIFSAEIDSYELSFEWNPFNMDLLMVSAFTEDWDFSTFLLDLNMKQLKELDLPEPFVRWVSDEELVFQEWEEQSIALQAPLKVISVDDLNTEQLFEDLYQFDAFGKYLITVKVEENEDSELAHYTIYAPGLEPAASFNVPVLTSFSGWLIPFYDLMNDGKEILYLRALHNGEADIYQDGFELVRLNLDTQKEDLIFSGQANEPISCSPSGEMCLTGFQYEKILNIEMKEIIELVK
ncbi:hypothetical protein V7654_14485 [Bacillus sp. JJ1609]|uniref:YqgU-like beta propeller domain-containing protein n=1 Tax=Bacillus sp. JJ1609 TaxID=3122977 RepID=UPI00300055E3